MFDFIFKRPAVPATAQTRAYEPQADNRPAQQEARLAALAQAEALSGDESAALVFLQQCEFAEARLKAAEFLQSRQVLESALHAIRNTDRRAAKLLQARLDALQQQDVAREQAMCCIADALKLAGEPHLMANHVADLDRAWVSIVAPPNQLRQEFEQGRAQLRMRLEAQAALQRSLRDMLVRLHAIRDGAAQMEPDAIEQALNALALELGQCRQSSETASLPKHLLPDFEQQFADLKGTMGSLRARHQAIGKRRELIEQWEAASAGALKEHALRNAWEALPALPQGETQSELQSRFDALFGDILANRQSKQSALKEGKQDAIRHFTETLEQMERALDSGSLQHAAEQDRLLRAIDLKSASLSDTQAEHLAKARAELGRLQSWAKWGGNISREELLKAAEGLPLQELAVAELAKKVGSLRERWKSMDVSAGPASRELWERFDAACSTAYAPAAAHFKKLADERQGNRAKAQALIAEVGQYAEAANLSGDGEKQADWKAVANFCQHATQGWQRLGAIDRKEKKRLDAEFALSMQVLLEPLAQQRELEVMRRKRLIVQATELNAGDRSALDKLRALQDQWQLQAKSLPLERKEEQALWQEFRGACDAVFSKRKENAAAADAERHLHLQAKDAICAAQEAALHGSEAEIAKALREGRDAWLKIGQVPRSAEAKIEARYKAAVNGLQMRLDAARSVAAAARATALRDKLRLCRKLELALADGSDAQYDPSDEWQANWAALPVLSNEFERTMRARFDAALAALHSDPAGYATVLERNRADLSIELLRLEIMSGIESPPELSQDRLKLQVELLRSTMKSGQKALSPEAQTLRVCGMAAAADEQAVSRIERLIGTSKNF